MASLLEEHLSRHQLTVLEETGNVLLVGSSFHPNSLFLEQLTFLAKKPVQFQLLSETAPAQRALRSAYPLREPAPTATFQSPFAGIAHLFETILIEALERSASDIHLQKADRSIRLRIDGQLCASKTILPKALYAQLINHVKIVCKLPFDQEALCQQGRLLYNNFSGIIIPLRISLLPTLEGESLAIRLPQAPTHGFDLETLNLPDSLYHHLRYLLEKEPGLFLIAGPTGSGKTTTFYAALQAISSAQHKKIITLEDPPEQYFQNLTQVAVGEGPTQLSYTQGLRLFLRQSPDALGLGEIRDAETLAVALQAALTGHVIFSSIHASDAHISYSRAKNLGASQETLTAGLSGILAQKLVRKVCEACKEEAPHCQAFIDALKHHGIHFTKPRHFTAKGCPICHFQGFKGRIGLFEFLCPKGRFPFTPMAKDALHKVLCGQTSFGEILGML